jgi:integrase
MGRRRKSNPLNLPPRVYAKHGAFYYFHPDGRWERIGTDVELVKRRAAEIVNNNSDGFGKVPYWFDEFIAHCRQRVAVGDLAPRTLEDYIDAGEKLKVWFKDFHPVGVEPHHVGDYLDKGLEMGRAVRANREKAALSVMFTWLIRKGYAGVRTNPCARIKRNKETKRERYVENDEMTATLAAAPVQVWALAHLVYRTLQRPEDIITWTPRNIMERRDASGQVVRIIRSQQGKTGVMVDIQVTPEIEALLAKLKAEPARKADAERGRSKVVTGLALIHRRDGKPYSYDGLCAMLKRRQAAVRKQHADKGGALAEMAPWGYYDMKGKGATDMWLAGVPLTLVQVLCGHDSVTTTEKYVKARWRGIVAPNQVAIGV